jgi:NADH-quinone oxidoreductase subunit M
MELLLLIFLPLIGALVTSFLKGSSAKISALIFSLASLALTLFLLSKFVPDATVQFKVNFP